MGVFPDDHKKSADSGADALIRRDGSALAAVARGEQYADVFTLTKANTNYLRGKRSMPASGLRGTTLVLIITALIVAGSGVFMYVEMDGIRHPTILFIFIMIAVVFVGSVLSIPYMWWRYLRFLRHGRLVLGEVVRTDGRWMAIGRSYTYTVTIHYEVVLPDGRKLSGRESRMRDDLGRIGLPPQRTRIAALYNPASGRLYLL